MAAQKRPLQTRMYRAAGSGRASAIASARRAPCQRRPGTLHPSSQAKSAVSVWAGSARIVASVMLSGRSTRPSMRIVSGPRGVSSPGRRKTGSFSSGRVSSIIGVCLVRPAGQAGRRDDWRLDKASLAHTCAGGPILAARARGAWCEAERRGRERTHTIGRPGRIPDEIDDDALDALNLADHLFNRRHHRVVQGAAARRQRHTDGDGTAVDLDAVDEPELDDIEAQLGVVDAVERFFDRVAIWHGAASATNSPLSR